MTRSERDHLRENLIAQVSKAMDAQGVNQAELARRMGSDRFSVNKVLKMKVDPRASTLFAMLKALNYTITMTPTDQHSSDVVD